MKNEIISKSDYDGFPARLNLFSDSFGQVLS